MTIPKLVRIADDHDATPELIAGLVQRSTPHHGLAAKDCVLNLDMPLMGGMNTAQALRDAVKTGTFDEMLRKPIRAVRLFGLIERA